MVFPAWEGLHMNFNGGIIKLKAAEAGLSMTALAERLHVTRQAVNTWLDGRVPRGKHLAELCSILGLRPADFSPYRGNIAGFRAVAPNNKKEAGYTRNVRSIAFNG